MTDLEDKVAGLSGSVGQLLEQTHQLVFEVEQLRLTVRDLAEAADFHLWLNPFQPGNTAGEKKRGAARTRSHSKR